MRLVITCTRNVVQENIEVIKVFSVLICHNHF